ncbi:hypothetical protein [Paenibacillus sp. Soil750]|uniref:hypothetical protein n=1 Tax=Paenibacillus sp. Soil750 TaxID=1736398 RepID=UPI0012FBC591|nr:hypothetical protein [Paenibacillus sp. Soil750]
MIVVVEASKRCYRVSLDFYADEPQIMSASCSNAYNHKLLIEPLNHTSRGG